ncbi:hypothetical protein ACQPXH_32175 [Nocardia sp. CA-135953]
MTLRLDDDDERMLSEEAFETTLARTTTPNCWNGSRDLPRSAHFP